MTFCGLVYPAKSIDIGIAIHKLLNGNEKDASKGTVESFERQTLKAYKESGYFSSVNSAIAGGELRAEVLVTDSTESFWSDYPNIGAFIQVSTLAVLPVRVTDVVTVRTSFKDQDGKELGSLEKTEVVYTWAELFLIFVMPFAPPDFDDVTLYDINRATLVDAAQRGWLEGQPDATPTAP